MTDQWANILTGAIGAGAALGTVYIKEILAERMKRNEKRVSLDQPTPCEILGPLLDEIRLELGAWRVMYWEGSNGTKTLGGIHIKRLSCICESIDPRGERLKDIFQNLSIETARRTISEMRHSQDIVVYSNEYAKNDAEATIYMNYGIYTVLNVKVVVNGVWSGFLNIGFRTKDQLFWQKHQHYLELMAGRIGIELEQLTKVK